MNLSSVSFISAILCASASSAFHSSSFCNEGNVTPSHGQPPWQVAPGPFANDPRMPALLEHASDARRKALARLRGEWGLSPGATPIRWRFDTAAAPPGPPAAEARAPRSEGPPDFELGRTYFDGGAVHVLLPARKFLARPGSVAAVVRHECFHAVHASSAGSRERYEAAPRWLREGTALLFSGEGDERVRERVAHSVYGGESASSFLKGIDSAEASRAEVYLAAAWLRAQLGADRFAGLVRATARGDSNAEPIAELGRFPLRDGALLAAKEAVRALLPPSREERFGELLARLRSDPAGVSTRLEVLLAEDEAGPLAGTLRYLLAREALRSSGNARALAAARAHLEMLLRAPGTLWRPEALVLLGHCYLKEGRRAAARRSWLEVTERFGEDRAVAEPARRLLAALAD